MEECSGGTLEDLIVNSNGKKLSEKQVSELMEHLFEGINHIHSQGICHRDLKPENILFSDNNDFSSLKIIDFGLGKNLNNPQEDNDFVGSPHYVAPEILKGNFDIKSDIWSAGVIMYSLLSGQFPFEGKNKNEIFEEIKKGEVLFPPKCKIKNNFILS